MADVDGEDDKPAFLKKTARWRKRDRQGATPFFCEADHTILITNECGLTAKIKTAESTRRGDSRNSQPAFRPQDMGNTPASRRGSDMESGGCHCFAYWE